VERVDRDSRVLIVIGLVSLLADFVYESFRSIMYILLAGLGLVNMCLVNGVGEAVLAIARFLSPAVLNLLGPAVTYILGYVLTGILIPCIVKPELSYVLYPAERFGKGVRGPARDLLISIVPKKPGYKFSICEALDQVGAVAGPLLALLLITRLGLLMTALSILYLLCLILSAHVYKIYRNVEKTLLVERRTHRTQMLTRKFIMFLVLLSFSTMFYMPLIMIQYVESFSTLRVETAGIVIFIIATIFTILFAPLIGKVVDTTREYCILMMPMSIAITVLTLSLGGSYVSMIIAGLIYGFVMSTLEIVPRAYVNYVVQDVKARKDAYAWLNVSLGVGLLVSSILIPFLYIYYRHIITILIVLCEAVAELLMLCLILLQ